MSDEQREIRCPECGARNTDAAQWCTQCYTPLSVPSTPPPPPPTHDAQAPQGAERDGLLPPPPAPQPSTTDTTDNAGAAAEGARTLQSGEGQFRETAEGLEWACAICQEWNPIERLTCSVCAAPFGRTLGADATPERPDVPPAVLIFTSLGLPGTGHWLLEMRGAAVLRAILGVVWGLGGLSLLLRARASGQSFLPAVPLLLGWAIVAVGSANDALVEAGGSGQRLLQGRVLLWLTLGVVGGTFAAVLVGVMSAVGQ